MILAGNYVLAQWQREAVDRVKPHHYTGALEQGLYDTSVDEVGFQGDSFVIELAVDASVHHALPLAYGGRRKGRRPPVEPIREWVAKKLGAALGTKENKSIAFLIQRKIGQVGQTTTADLKDYAMDPLKANSAKWFKLIADYARKYAQGKT